MNILQFAKDERLARPFLGSDLSSWRNWQAFLRCAYGLRIPESQHAIIRECTGRDASTMPREGFNKILALCGRRSGKSKIAALIASYEAALANHDARLTPGERGLVAVVSPSKVQSRIVRNYVRGVFTADLLQNLISRETINGFDLSTGISVDVATADHRTIRGSTGACYVLDEICFHGILEESKISDTELVRAVLPSLATLNGKLLAISSPHAPRGWAYDTWKRHWGVADSDVLVWRAPSRTMNPCLPQSVIDQALRDDLAAARSEFLAEWREDIGLLVDRNAVEALVVPGRTELYPEGYVKYTAFVDLSGGRGDSAALCIGHREGRKIVLSLLREFRAPFNPYEIVARMCAEAKRYNVKTLIGDNFSADFLSRAVESCGLRYSKSEKPKSALYLELLPILSSGLIELLDDPVLIHQLTSLERHARAGGRDIVDHPPRSRDDVANAAAGCAVCCNTQQVRVGAVLSR